MTDVDTRTDQTTRLGDWDITHLVCCVWEHHPLPVIAACGIDCTDGRPVATGGGATCLACDAKTRGNSFCPAGGTCGDRSRG